jgi:DNA-binding HxlR family transcriptional regulator
MDGLQKIAEENERKILSAISTGPKGWGELLKVTKLSKKGLAKHLKRLLNNGLITEEIDRKDRRKKIYRLKPVDETVDSISRVIITLNFLEHVIRAFHVDESEEKRLENLERTIGLTTLLCLSVGREGLEVLKEYNELLSEYLKDSFPQIDEFKEAFQKIRDQVRELVKIEIENKGYVDEREIIGKVLLLHAIFTALESISEKDLNLREEESVSANDLYKK